MLLTDTILKSINTGFPDGTELFDSEVILKFNDCNHKDMGEFMEKLGNLIRKNKSVEVVKGIPYK